MASEDSAADAERQECTACRGTGRVISNLGGNPHPEQCPWCEGTGRFIPGHDAQARWRRETAGASSEES